MLGDLGHSLETPAARLLACWDEAVGGELAARCEPCGWSGAELEVRCESSAWAQHLKAREAETLAALTAVLGEEAPTRLRVRIR